jgi:hypothetical protein
MSEASALVVVGENEDLCLSGKSAKGRCVEDAVAVALEACAKRVGFFRCAARACADGARGIGCEEAVFVFFAFLAPNHVRRTRGCPGVGVGKTYV